MPKHKKEREARYEDKLVTVTDLSESPLLKYFSFFHNAVGKDAFWADVDEVIDHLCQFCRYFVLSRSLDADEYTKGLDDFTRDIVTSRRYRVLLKLMDAWGNMWHEGGESEKTAMTAFNQRKSLAKEVISKVCSMYENISGMPYLKLNAIDYPTIISFVINCLVLSTQNPSVFEQNADSFFREMASGVDKDVDAVFGEDLDESYEKDDRDVEDRILYYSDEDYEPPSKKREEGEGMIRKNPSDMLMGKKDLLGFLKWISKLG